MSQAVSMSTESLLADLPRQRLLKKNAIVTGGAAGIGAGIVETFIKHGANVAVIDIAPFDNIQSTISSIQKSLQSANLHSPNCFYMKCDVSDETQVCNTINKLVKNSLYFGSKIDILVNNAAKFVLNNVVDAELSEWETSIKVNILGYINMMKHCIRNENMKYTINDLSSSIINISSGSAFLAQPNMATYSMCKAATVSLTRNSSLDFYSKYGIRVNAICPGAIFTDASIREMKIQGWTKDEWSKIKMGGAIIQRPGTPKEVSMAVLYYASDDSKFCTGSVLCVDGGWSTL